MEVATNLLEDTVFTLTNTFNTLYPTAAKPVVDGTLTGQTLVNLCRNLKDEKSSSFNASTSLTTDTLKVKTNTTYITIAKVKSSNLLTSVSNTSFFRVDADTGNVLGGISGDITTEYTTKSFTFNTKNTTEIKFNLRNAYHDWGLTKNTSYIKEIMLIEYQDGMENWDIPYFEGMQSVKAPGVTMTNEDNTQSTTLSTPSDLELRKVGEVQDEVNMMTGEVVERIGEIVFDGSQDMNSGDTANWNNDGNTIGFYIKSSKTKNNIGYSDKLPLMSDIKKNDTECFYINSAQKWIGIRLLKSKLSELTDAGLKAYLEQNPITIQYQLATPTTKTVDLSVVNQDGNKTKLKTFDDTTHVLLNSEGIPMSKASLTVRTKIPSGSSTNLLMDDILNKQQQLGATVDKQSNNIDATMMATTEIFEETL